MTSRNSHVQFNSSHVEGTFWAKNAQLYHEVKSAWDNMNIASMCQKSCQIGFLSYIVHFCHKHEKFKMVRKTLL